MSSGSRKTCPICQKRVGGSNAELEAHYRAELASLSHLPQDPVARSQRADPDREVYEQAVTELRTRRVTRTTGVAPPTRRTPGGDARCFMCGITLPQDDLDVVNAHIDGCLGQPPSTPLLETGASTPSAVETDTGFEEYTWAGETRVRATTMTPSVSQTSRSTALDEDLEDVNVDEDDTQEFGIAQFSETDLASVEEEGEEEGVAMEVELTAVEKGAPAALSVTDIAQPLASDSLIIQSLKARIWQQEQAASSTPALKCLICMDAYAKPVVSIVCWHVHCEACWMQTLRAKKLCPQCQKITLPSDLRRIFL